MIKNLLEKMVEFYVETDAGSYTLGYTAVKTGRLVERRGASYRICPENVKAVRKFMRQYNIFRTIVPPNVAWPSSIVRPPPLIG